jgi:hypothetical protein
MLVAVIPLSCAHRRPGSTALIPPPAPPRASASTEHFQSAAEPPEQLRKKSTPQLNNPVRRESRLPEGVRPTDAPDEPAARRPLGTTWSVVVSQTPASGGNSGARPPLASEGRDAEPPPRMGRTLDLFGGAVAALCGTLAIRKRVRESRPN